MYMYIIQQISPHYRQGVIGHEGFFYVIVFPFLWM